MKIVKKIIIVIVSLALLGTVMAYLSGFFENKIAWDEAENKVVILEDRSLLIIEIEEPLIEQAVGTLRAKVETVISPMITATIVSIAVRAGDEVKVGELLLELDSRELNARVAQTRQSVVAAEARLAKIEKDYKRLDKMYRAKAISKSEFDRTQMALQTSRAEVKQVRRLLDQDLTSLSYSRIISPISGRVIDRYADPGDTARQGETLLRIYDPASLRLEANVRESIASQLKLGQRLTAKIDAIGQNIVTSVEEIVPSADPGSRTFLVKTGLDDNRGLYPGMFGRLQIPVGKTKKIYIPVEAVTNTGQLNFVHVLTDEEKILRYVRLGRAHDNGNIEVMSGLLPGEEIIISEKQK